MSNLKPAGPVSSHGAHNGNGVIESVGDTSGLSQTLQGHVDDIRTLIQCGICIRPLYEPFTLACGHTFCYTCLTSWFGGGRSKKTCPDCRAPVKSEPSPAYLVRAVVQLFTSRAELLDKGETTAEHEHHQREEAQKIDNDKKNTNPREGGLFKGIFRARPPTMAPFVDLEDGVLRCPVCSWELEANSNCEQCGYRPEEGSDTDSSGYLSDDLDENSEMTDYLDDEAEDGFDEVDASAWNDLYDGGLPFDLHHHLYQMRHDIFYHQPHPFHPAFQRGIPSDDRGHNDTMSSVVHDSEEEDSEDADMDSFIDDDEHYGQGEYESESDRSTVVGAPEYTTQDRYAQHHEYSDIPMSQLGDFASDGMSDITGTEITGTEITGTEENDENDDDNDEDTDGDDDDGSDDDDDSDESDDDEPIRPAVSGNRRRPAPVYQISSSPLQPRIVGMNWHPAEPRTASHAQSPPTAGNSVTNAISLEDDSDEGPVGPTRRARR